MEDVLIKIDNLVKTNHVVLYLKGTPDFPQCGFSYRVVEILNQLGCDYCSVDVLADDSIRQGIKEYGKWPTIPQLYIKGKLIGGCDIVTQLNDSGELEKIITDKE